MKEEAARRIFYVDFSSRTRRTVLRLATFETVLICCSYFTLFGYIVLNVHWNIFCTFFGVLKRKVEGNNLCWIPSGVWFWMTLKHWLYYIFYSVRKKEKELEKKERKKKKEPFYSSGEAVWEKHLPGYFLYLLLIQAKYCFGSPPLSWRGIHYSKCSFRLSVSL